MEIGKIIRVLEVPARNPAEAVPATPAPAEPHPSLEPVEPARVQAPAICATAAAAAGER